MFVITGPSSGFRLALKLLAKAGRKHEVDVLLISSVSALLVNIGTLDYLIPWPYPEFLIQTPHFYYSGSVLPLAEPSCEFRKFDQNDRSPRRKQTASIED